MRDILRLLNDRSLGDLTELNDDELQSFEALCERWRMLAETELAANHCREHRLAD